MSNVPERLEMKAIAVPSGDQAGPQSDAGSSVSCRTPVPSARITKMSGSPSRLPPKTICEPSGDQAGSKLSPSDTSGRSSLPSARITWICPRSPLPPWTA